MLFSGIALVGIGVSLLTSSLVSKTIHSIKDDFQEKNRTTLEDGSVGIAVILIGALILQFATGV